MLFCIFVAYKVPTQQIMLSQYEKKNIQKKLIETMVHYVFYALSQ